MRKALLPSSLLVLSVLVTWACGGSDSGARDQANNTGGSGGGSAGSGGGAGGSTGGATPTGGATTGGSGGSTGTVTSKCGTGPFPVAAGTELLIDDLEDGNIDIPTNDSRINKWQFEKDTTATGTSSPATAAALLPVDGGANNTTKALHVSGEGFTAWGVALIVGFNNAPLPNCPYDASAYGGVSFYAKGEGEIRLAIVQSDFYPTSLGGTCVSATPNDGDCFNNYGKAIPLTADWTKFDVAWTDLSQGNWGKMGAFDASKVMMIQFVATPEQQPFDFWVDEVNFLAKGSNGGGEGGSNGGGEAGSGGAGGGG